MAKAVWKGVVLAESDQTEIVEGNHYFPMGSVKQEYFTQNAQTTVCPWKGTANYYDIQVNGDVNSGGAWFYANPKPAAANIKDRVAFWRGVEVTD